jgi:hypothetical protein
VKALLLGFIFCCALSSSLLADFELCLTDSGSCSSGDYVVISSAGHIVSKSATVTGTAGTIGSDVDFSGMVGSYGLTFTVANQSALTLTIGGGEVAFSGAGPLDILLSEDNITIPTAGWTLTFAGLLASSGSGAQVSDSAFGSTTSNNFFGTGTPIANLGPYNAGVSFSGFATGPSAAGLESVTDEIKLIGAGTTSLTAMPSIVAPVPEPLSVILFGTVIVICASILRKRLKCT